MYGKLAIVEFVVRIDIMFFTERSRTLIRAKKIWCDDDTYITYHARGSPRQLEVSNWTLYVKISPYASCYRSRLLDLLTNSTNEKNRKVGERAEGENY